MFNRIDCKLGKVCIQQVPDEYVTNFKLQDENGLSIVVGQTKEILENEDSFWQSYEIKQNEFLVGCYGFTDDSDSIIGLGFVVLQLNLPQREL